MTISPYIPRNAISLARISDVRADPATGLLPTDGVDRQVATHHEWAERHGWRIGLVIRSNKLGGYHRRKTIMPDGTEQHRVWRPDLQRAFRLLWNRVHDGLILTDLDRYGRDPYDLEDAIVLVEARPGELRIGSLTGTLKLDTSADRVNARMHMIMARKASEDTARRVSDARTRLALAGKNGGGPRPYGFGVPVFDEDGEPVIDHRTGRQAWKDFSTVCPEEAAEIAKASAAVLAGVSLRACVQDLRDRGVPTVTGCKWTPETLKDILVRPRNAGLMVNKGEVIGDAPWPPIVPAETWRGIVARMEARKTGKPGPAPKWFGSGIYRCACGLPMQVVRKSAPSSSPRYICDRTRPGPHTIRDLARTDEWVETTLIEFLRRPDVAGPVLQGEPGEGIDVGALRARAAELQQNMDDLVDAKSLGAIDQRRLLRGAKLINDELAEIDAALTTDASDDLIKPLIGADSTEAAWKVWRRMSLGARREVLRRYLVVTLVPLGVGKRWAPEGIRITPADPGECE